MKKSEKPYDLALKIMRRANPDPVRAKALLEEAMAAKDHRATYALGTWYIFGMPPVIEINHRTAAKLFRIAANAGIPEAQHDYAISLEKGAGLRRNDRLAFNFHLRAALSGHLNSIGEVGRMYYYGIGVAQDRRVARVWLARHHFLSGEAN